jgi:uncharacterized protein (DUF58 family)
MLKQYPPPSMSPAKDPADYPLFKGKISQGVWRIFTQRLTPAGRWFAMATILLASYGGASSLQLQGYIPASYLLAVWVIAIALMLARRPRATLKARHASRICAGQVLPIDLEIKQLSRTGGADLVALPHKLPMAIDAVPAEGLRLPDMRRNESAAVRIGLLCRERGKFLLHGFRIETGFPFGILRSRRIFRSEQAVLVYPRFEPLARLNLPSGRRYQPGGVAMASNLGESFEYLGNREYREGDNVRDIDWRATARIQRPIVREWVEEYMLRVAVVLDTSVAKNAPQIRVDDFERAVSVAAAVSDYMARQDYLVDLFAAGDNLYHLTAGRSLAYLDQILDILACVEHTPGEPFETIEPQIGELMGRISTVICVFLDWNDGRRAFVDRLRMQGAAVKVILVRNDSPTMPAIDERQPHAVIDKEMFEAGLVEL